MIVSVLGFFEKNAEKIKDDNIVKKTLVLIAAYMKSIAVYQTKQDEDITGISKKKQKVKKNLAKMIFVISSIVRSWALDNKNYPVYNAIDDSMSDIARLGDLAILTYADIVKRLATDNADKLAVYGLDKEMQDNLDAAVDEFNNWKSKPREARKEKVDASKQLKSKLNELREVVYDNLKNAMEKYIVLDNDFYSAYELIIEIDDPGSNRYALIGLVTDEETKLGVANVAVTIIRSKSAADITDIVKLTGDKGHYLVKELEPGKYTARFEKGGYDTLEKIFYINVNETTRLDVAIRVTE